MPLLKAGEMNPMAGVWLSMTTGSSEGTGEKGGGKCYLYIRRGRECQELSLKNSCEQVGSVWIRIRV